MKKSRPGKERVPFRRVNFRDRLYGKNVEVFSIRGGILPYVSHIGMCRPKGHSFAPFWAEKGYTGCPKSSFLYFISLYFSTIGLGKKII